MGLSELQIKTCKAIVSIFETGQVRGRYDALAVLADGAGISYGKHQATLRSGNLTRLLLHYYLPQASPANAALLDPYLQLIEERDERLNTDERFKSLLRVLGAEDPIMRRAQEALFDEQFWQPAEQFCSAAGLATALSHAVVYDSWIQGGFERVRRRVQQALPVRGGREHAWIPAYLQARINFLAHGNSRPMRRSVYRPQEFLRLIAEQRWDLSLPLKIRGVLLTQVEVEHAA